jgi:hypothetical protein
MEPATYLAGERVQPMPVADFKRDFKDYKKFDIGAMGEFDVAVLMDQYAGKAISKQIYPAWRGGYYYAAKAKSNETGPLALLYVSRWSSPEKAAEFAAIYADSLKQRYKKSEATRGAASAAPDPPTQGEETKHHLKLHALKGHHEWNTEEGQVVIEEQGDTVFIAESLDPATTATLEREVLGK